MAKGPQFPVYDIETDRFELIPLKVIETSQPKFEKLKIPRFGKFDLYASNVHDEDTEQSYRIINRGTQDTRGSSFVVRLNYGGLGFGVNVRRKFLAKHRVLYVGDLGAVEK